MKPSFLADEMLNDVAVWLRLCGFAAVYKKWGSDTEIISEALKSGSIVLTSDRELASRCSNKGVKAILLPVWSPHEEKLALALSGAGIKEIFPETVCTSCNGTLKKASKEEVRGKVPDAILDKFDDFLMCTSCGKVYWHGSHWQRIKEALDGLKTKIAQV
jgi:uncharacterized protein with PIN domain